MDKLMRRVETSEGILALLGEPGFSHSEQWQPHIQALIQRRAEVRVHSSLPVETLRAMHLEECSDIAAAVAERVRRIGPGARVAVLPQGPLTIPYLG